MRWMNRTVLGLFLTVAASTGCLDEKEDSGVTDETDLPPATGTGTGVGTVTGTGTGAATGSATGTGTGAATGTGTGTTDTTGPEVAVFGQSSFGDSIFAP